MVTIGIFGGGGAKGADVLPKPNVDLASDNTAKAGETRTAIFAGGCFWCVEAVFEQLEGVTDAVSGYAGDTKETANYKMVCTGATKHAEAVMITYEPAKISYGQLLRVFFATHNPTTLNRQGPDSGPQYRSTVFYLDDEQKTVAEAYIKQLDEAKAFDSKIVTTLEPLKKPEFYVAEEYHQNYAACNANNPYIRAQAVPKVKKVHEKFSDQVKKKEEEKK